MCRAAPPLQGEMLVAQDDTASSWASSRPTARRQAHHRLRIRGAGDQPRSRNPSLGQLYRDRADAENAFDELKNQWGWGGFTTHDLHRCQLSARGVALIYNWWSLFVRLAKPEARLEAITSRPWLMSSVGRRTEHAGQTTITLTGQHAYFDKARQLLMHISSQLQAWVSAAAEQFDGPSVWLRCCAHLKRTLAAIGPPKPPPSGVGRRLCEWSETAGHRPPAGERLPGRVEPVSPGAAAEYCAAARDGSVEGQYRLGPPVPDGAGRHGSRAAITPLSTAQRGHERRASLVAPRRVGERLARVPDHWRRAGPGGGC